MKVSDYNKLQVRAAQLQSELGEIQQQLEEFRLEQIRKVNIQRNSASITLTFKERTLNVSRDRHGYTQVKEKGKFIAKNLFVNVHDIRFAVSLGQL